MIQFANEWTKSYWHLCDINWHLNGIERGLHITIQVAVLFFRHECQLSIMYTQNILTYMVVAYKAFDPHTIMLIMKTYRKFVVLLLSFSSFHIDFELDSLQNIYVIAMLYLIFFPNKFPFHSQISFRRNKLLFRNCLCLHRIIQYHALNVRMCIIFDLYLH